MVASVPGVPRSRYKAVRAGVCHRSNGESGAGGGGRGGVSCFRCSCPAANMDANGGAHQSTSAAVNKVARRTCMCDQVVCTAIVIGVRLRKEFLVDLL